MVRVELDEAGDEIVSLHVLADGRIAGIDADDEPVAQRDGAGDVAAARRTSRSPKSRPSRNGATSVAWKP
jgi:hypothetical protein